MDISTNVAYLAALSMAAERLVQIIRGIPGLELATENEKDLKAEARRSAKINGLAVLTGLITSAIAHWLGVLPVAKNWPEVLMYGVLAGAGSGFWNAVLSYLLELKSLNKSLASSARHAPGTPMVFVKAAGR
jgi:hypothetical protein